ncbi:MAG: TetR/AcrR family transcriptional regulator [Deltaproteobacteria bacterium]|nr:TetR/AcrR family transcriptional regulator [Deltaproteobacteria bacterium]
MASVRSTRYTPLRRGQHKLSRAEVAASQRGRMLEAMVEAAAELGYAGASVAEVIARASVSRRTFYEQFADKEDCFCAAYDAATRILIDELRAALEPPGSPAERVERMVGAYLDRVAAEPAGAKVFLIEALAAGPVVLARRMRAQETVAELVAATFGAGTDAARFACTALVHALISIVTAHVAMRRMARVGTLRAPIAQLVRQTLRPFEPPARPRVRPPTRRRS